MRLSIVGVALGLLCCPMATAAVGEPTPVASMKGLTVAALANLLSKASNGTVQVLGAYRVGPAVPRDAPACPISIRGSVLRCAPASDIRPFRIGAVRPFYREQHGFIDLGCVKQPCLFTMPGSQEIAQVPDILARGIGTGGSILVLMTRASDGQQVKSYVFSADREPGAASCMYPAADQQLTGESNTFGCQSLQGVF